MSGLTEYAIGRLRDELPISFGSTDIPMEITRHGPTLEITIHEPRHRAELTVTLGRSYLAILADAARWIVDNTPDA